MSTEKRDRLRLDRTTVLEGALRLVDAEGADSLSMRRLASTLEVPTMSLYSHVRSREDLLTGLSEVMVQRIGMRFGEEPTAALQRLAAGIRRVAHDHPAAFTLVGMRPLRTDTALRVVDAGLGALRAMGLDDPTAVSAYRVLVSYVRGFALSEIATFTLEELPATPPDPAAFPHVSELAGLLADTDRTEAFQLGVDVLISGFANLGTP